MSTLALQTSTIWEQDKASPHHANGRGHGTEGVTSMQEIPYGFCQCGCGRKAPICSCTNVTKGLKAGEPVRYLPGHWMRRDPLARFWEKVDKNGPTPAHCPEIGRCWVWTAAVSQFGYGKFSLEGGKEIRAHQFSYSTFTGPLVKGMAVCHRCDNRRCVNPTHLFQGTYQDNVLDMHRKGRNADVRGERNAQAKLNREQVVEIRRLLADGNLSQSAIGRRFGVTLSAINAIAKGKTWRDVA